MSPTRGYTLTSHARFRIQQRQITDEQMAQALAGETWTGSGVEYFYSRSHRILIVACPLCHSIVTVYTLSTKQARQMVSRMNGGIHARGSYIRNQVQPKWQHDHD